VSFRRSVIIASYGGQSRKSWEKVSTFGVSLEKRPLTANVQNSLPKGFTVSPIYVLCVNFVKFGRPEIGKVVRYLPDKKKQKFASFSRGRF